LDRNISPHIYALSTIVTVMVSYLAFYYWKIDSEYFPLPIFGLAVIYAGINFYRQAKYNSLFNIDRQADIYRLFNKSVWRYLVWLLLLCSGYQFYTAIPYYNSSYYQPNIKFFEKLIEIYLIVGLPYFMLTLKFKSSRIEDFYDPALRMIHIFKQITLRTLRGDGLRSIFRVLGKRYNRKILLNLIMRTYFIPVMVSQIHHNMSNALEMTHTYTFNHAFINLLMLFSALIWLTDTVNASLAYCMESRWIENRTRSIDLTVTGWAVCLFCYPPLNTITSALFPFAPGVVDNNPASLVYNSLTLFYIAKVLQISLLALHVYIDLSLGPSVANITFKRLQTKGLYGIVRHPGTVTKLFFWLVISSFYRNFWSTKMLFGQLCWSIIYVLRALTEERHLRQHTEYRRYQKKVRYRFIPGLC